MGGVTGTAPPWRRPWVIALGWALLAVLLRALWLRSHPAVAAWDGLIYQRTAERIARGMGFVDTWNNRPPFRATAFYPVGYPALLGACYAVFGPRLAVAGWLNVAAGGLATVATSRLAYRAYGVLPAHVAGALFALSPGAVVFTSTVMTEPVAAAVACGATLTAARYARTAGARWALATGAILGVAALLRPQALLLAPVIAVVAAPTRDARGLARALVLVGVACAAVVLPWTARNCARLDGCALVSVNGGSNLWIGADPAARGGYRDLRVGEGCDRVHGEVAKDRCYGRLALRRIARAPLAWLALAPAKLRETLDYEASPVAYLEAGTHGRAFGQRAVAWVQLLTSYHQALLALALLGLVPLAQRRRRARARPEVRLMVAFIATTLAVHAVFFGGDRYHFMFTPLLCALAAGVFRAADEPELA
jgi:4-amino-4-deoxy-L-arabinose transferase-like glycosyltransferase